MESDNKLSQDVNLLKGKKIKDYLYKNILDKVNENHLISIMIYTLCIVATYNGIVEGLDQDNNDVKPLTPLGGGKTVVTNNAIFMGKNVVDFYIKAVYDCDGKGYVSLKTFKIDFLNHLPAHFLFLVPSILLWQNYEGL